MKPVPTFSWEEIDNLRESVVREREEGTFTAKEYAHRYKLKRTTAQGELNKLVKAGFLEVTRGIETKHAINFYRRATHAKETKQSMSRGSDG